MDGIKAYSKPSATGGVTIDVERMLVDLITVYKAGGFNKDDFLREAGIMFDQVHVEIDTSAVRKH